MSSVCDVTSLNKFGQLARKYWISEKTDTAGNEYGFFFFLKD